MFEAIHSAREVGVFMRRRRKELGLDQATLARKAGVSRLWISQIERGKDSAAIGLVFKTLMALGVSLMPTIRETLSGQPASEPISRTAAGDINLDAILMRARGISTPHD